MSIWSKHEDITLSHLYLQNGIAVDIIAAMLNRSIRAIRTRLSQLRLAGAAIPRLAPTALADEAFYDLPSRRECHWIEGDGADRCWCREPVHRRSYCSAHYARAYEPKVKK